MVWEQVLCVTGFLVTSERLQSMLPCFIVDCLYSENIGGPRTVRGDQLQHPGWSQGGPIMLPWTVQGDHFWEGGGGGGALIVWQDCNYHYRKQTARNKCEAKPEHDWQAGGCQSVTTTTDCKACDILHSQLSTNRNKHQSPALNFQTAKYVDVYNATHWLSWRLASMWILIFGELIRGYSTVAVTHALWVLPKCIIRWCYLLTICM